jgi:hypothetical protein
MFLPWQKKLGIRYGLKRAGSEAAGVTGNCFVVLGDGPNVKILRIVFPELDDEDREFIEDLLGGLKVKKFQWLEREIVIRFAEFFIPYSVEKIAAFIDAAVSRFTQKYRGLSQSCHGCGSDDACEVYAGAGVTYLCEKCFFERQEAVSAARENYDSRGNYYLPGFFGALIFALPGAVLAVLLFVFLDTIAAVSTVLCMVLAQKGYAKCRGKNSPAGAVLVSAAGIIMTVAGIFTGYVAYIVKLFLADGYTTEVIFPILNIVIREPELLRELFGNIGIALLVSAVYIILHLRTMMKEWRFPKITKAEEITG